MCHEQDRYILCLQPVQHIGKARLRLRVESFCRFIEQQQPRFCQHDLCKREKLLLNLRQEVPHSVAVTCDDIDYSGDHATVTATIIVEREGQKGIVIGHGGKMIKKVGTEARRDIERLFDCSCYLDLQVRVKPEWRRDQNEIRRLGYEAE